MAARADRVYVFGEGLLSSYPLRDPNVDLTEVEVIIFNVGIILCFVISAGTVIICTVKVLYHFAVFAYYWYYDRLPETRYKELDCLEKEIELREEEIELKEAKIAQEARSVVIDVEIGVCKRIVENLQPILTNAEVRKLELEREKELLLQEISLRDNRQALDEID
ncbi:hypothetical protein FB446DRAFT_705446 [Lentinula raphanica]|nr:hypothetical protein FB446DRAFT_705446 [Lentinula raphanica]